MKRVLYAALICFVALATLAARGQEKGGRYDQQILSNVARVLSADAQFKNVTVQVEDGVVILGGSVELDSVRRDLAVKIGHIDHVAEVVNQIVLSPAAVPDNILSDLVASRLADAGYPEITVAVHEGAVTLHGAVRTQRSWNWVRQLVALTPGVKEVQAMQLQIVAP
ncbi:MAG TPA: BON domain-containing protein [Candidatus Angelobacter sp.]|nr:BON domain-containing protein [Candidatus Angelobacter sp.]